ncbi:MAG: BON domain-containing protein [Planctomycetota bacterium]
MPLLPSNFSTRSGVKRSSPDALQSRARGLNAKQIRIDYPDDDLRLRVSRFLSSRHFTTFMNLEVQVRHGEVTISGEVDSFYEKQIAMTSCQHVAGVLALVDHIKVRKPK